MTICIRLFVTSTRCLNGEQMAHRRSREMNSKCCNELKMKKKYMTLDISAMACLNSPDTYSFTTFCNPFVKPNRPSATDKLMRSFSYIVFPRFILNIMLISIILSIKTMQLSEISKYGLISSLSTLSNTLSNQQKMFSQSLLQLPNTDNLNAELERIY